LRCALAGPRRRRRCSWQIPTQHTSFIFRVDQSTGVLTTLLSLGPNYGQVLGLAAASDNLLYAVAGNGGVSQLTVNPPTIAALGNIGEHFVAGLAYANGKLYAIDQATDTLSTIDLAPVAQTTIGVLHVGSPGGPVFDVDGADLAQDSSGTWYVWTNAAQQLYQLDVTNAVVTPIGSSGLGAKTGLAFDYQNGDVLLAASRPLDTLQTIDKTTGQVTSSVNFCLNCPTVYDHRFGDIASPRCTDSDNDGYSPEGGPCGAVDCNDNDPLIHRARASAAMRSTTTATARSTTSLPRTPPARTAACAAARKRASAAPARRGRRWCAARVRPATPISVARADRARPRRPRRR
jgi:hypothetical protein